MATVDVFAPGEALAPTSREVINDFSIQVATVNGSGSQSANLILLRALFQMGIPVSGKNLFPSNIAGLPTWYTIRAGKHGFVGRKKEIDFLVAMNPETAREDVINLDPGAAVLYDEPLNLKALRSDVHFYAAPFDKLVAPLAPPKFASSCATSSTTACWPTCSASSWKRCGKPCSSSSHPSSRRRR